MTEIQPNSTLDRSTILRQSQSALAKRVEDVAGMVAHHLASSAFEPQTSLIAVEAKAVLPFCDRAAGQVLPADKAVLAKHIPGYQEPSPELLAECEEYRKAPNTYGSAPPAMAALLTQLARATNSKAAFVFGTARGHLERTIAKNSPGTVVVTLDIPQELLGIAPGSPDKNNLRYREGTGVDENSKIGSLFTSDPDIKHRVHQLLGDSYLFDPAKLSGTMGLIVIDANHSYITALKDLANALELASTEGAVIVLDDFRKKSCLNAGVEAAAVTFSHLTGLPILQPCPKPSESGFEAEAGIIIVPAGFERATNAKRIHDIIRGMESPL